MSLTNVFDLPAPFVDAVSKKHEYTPKRYSVTSLLKGATQCVLERRHANEITADVSEYVWAIFGSAVHQILENSQEGENQIKECKLTAPVPGMEGYTLSGIFDLFDTETGTVYDYKTCSMWKVTFEDWADYRQQLLCYCWLLRQNGYINARNGVIVAFIKDHNKRKAKTEQGYPAVPVHVEEFEFSDDEIEMCEQWIIGRFAMLKSAENTPDFRLPPCLENERWYTGTRWAVMKPNHKKAVRVFSSYCVAKEYIENHPNKDYEIERREGENRRCEDYCSCAPFCNWWQSQLEIKEVIGGRKAEK